MRLIPILFLIVLTIVPLAADDFKPHVCTDSSGESMGYELLTPTGYDKNQKYPVVLFLHGSGERGSDNQIQLRNGARDYAAPAFQAKYPCFVIVPQCPANQQWVDIDYNGPSGIRLPAPTQAMQLALKILDHVTLQFNIDKSRIYLVGLSMGGYAVWDCITRHPDRFAAGVICCGGGDESTVTAAVARVPVWAFHSTDDPVVPVIRDRNMIAAMTRMGGHPRYIEYTLGIGHCIWSKAWEDVDLFPWLFRQKLTPPVGA